MENSIKPCPFCGSGSANLYRKYGRRGYFVFVSCDFCKAQSKPYSADDIKDIDEFWKQESCRLAVEAWNMRVKNSR